MVRTESWVKECLYKSSTVALYVVQHESTKYSVVLQKEGKSSGLRHVNLLQ